MRIRKGFFICLLLAVFFSVNAVESVEAKVDYKQVLRKVSAINRKLNSFKADLKINVFFLGMKQTFPGELYYKKPDKFRMIFPTIPMSLKQRKKMFKRMLPMSYNVKDYEGEVLKSEKLAGKFECYVLKLKPLKSDTIKKVLLWVDKKTYLAPRTVVYYKSGSVITTTQTFKKEKSYILPDRQVIDFDLSGHFAGQAEILVKKYDFNAKVDHVFNKPQKTEED